MGNEASQQVKYGNRLDNDIKIVWKKASCEMPFPARDGHCASAVGNKLYVFGGVLHTETQSDENHETNDLLVFDTDSETWSKAEVKGQVPAARSSATMAAVDKKLYLYGGLSQDSGWFEGLHVYDTETSTWSIPETSGSSPSPRDKLASAVVNGKVYFFGGFGPQGDVDEELEEDDDDEEYQDLPDDQEGAQFGWFNDLFIFDPATNTWSSPMQMNLGVPTQRAAHALCAMGKYLVIFGGRDSEARKNDTHIFDTETRKWLTDMKLSGRQPEPRSFHTATTVGDRVVVLGGRGIHDQHFSDFNIFDTSSQQWLQPTIEGDSFPARGVHTATLVGDWLVVFGGSAEFNKDIMMCTKYYNDVFMVKSAAILSGGPRQTGPHTPCPGAAGDSSTSSEATATTSQESNDLDEPAPAKKTRTEPPS